MRKSSLSCSFGVLVAVASAGCGRDTPTTPDPLISYQVECDVHRSECSGWIPKNDTSHVNDVSCPRENVFPSTVLATMCFNSTAANRDTSARDACFRYCEGDLTSGLYPLAPDLPETFFEHITCESVVKDMVASSIRDALPGECPPAPGSPTGTSGGGATTRVMCSISGRTCDAEITLANGETVCSIMTSQTYPPVDECFDPSVTNAEDVCRNKRMLEFPSWHVDSVDASSENGCVAAAPAALTRLGIAAGPIGSVGLNGTTASLVARGGFMTTTRSCDESGEFCTDTLNSLRVQFQDTTLAGLTFHNPQMQLVAPVTEPIGAAPLSPRVTLDADVTAIGHVSLTTPNSPTFTLTRLGTTATVNGTVNMPVHINTVAVSPLIATVSLSGSTTSPNAGCSNLTPQQQLLGFESASNWNGTVPLTLVASPKTQGCFALAVGGSNFRTINSARFTTPLAGTTGTLRLDVFIPPAQPNPFWLGAVQMYLTCPNFTNQYIGQVELTGRPVGAFSTLQYAIPAPILNQLQASQTGCFFSIAVNMNPTPTAPILDNLRFN